MRDHERLEALLAAQALGGLDPEDAELLARERAEHGPGCKECARLEREYVEVAGHLALALDAVPVREGLEDEVVARALRRTRGPAMPRPAAWRRLPMLAAAAALLVGGWVLRDLTLPERPAGPPPGFLAEATIVRFEGPGEGTLAVAFRPTRPGAYLLGADLPAPPEGNRYELWVFHEGQPASGGCFAPEDGTVVMPLEADVGAADLLAVTIEPAACPVAPTTDPILTADPTAV